MTKPLTEPQRRALWIAAVLAPTLAVQGARFLAGSGLAKAPAATLMQTATPVAPRPEQAPAALTAKPLTPSQRMALEYLSAPRQHTPIRSPMDEPEAPSPPPAPAPPVAPPTPTPVDPVPDLTVTAVLGSGSTDLAIIAHRLRKVGDEIAPGWTITAIEAHQRLVRIRHTDGRTAEFSPQAGRR